MPGPKKICHDESIYGYNPADLIRVGGPQGKAGQSIKGPKGDKGDRGLAGVQGVPGQGMESLVVEREAGESVGGHRIVRVINGSVTYADNSDESHGDDVLGMTINAALKRTMVSVLVQGFITEPSWNWTPGLPLFLGNGGLIVQTLSSDPAFYLPVGFAETETTAFIKIGESIYL